MRASLCQEQSYAKLDPTIQMADKTKKKEKNVLLEGRKYTDVTLVNNDCQVF